jgi:zinc transport system substrate-binding protein
MKFYKVIVSLFLITLLSACNQKRHADNPQNIKVSATIAPISDIAKKVGKDKVDVQTVIPSTQDPHNFEPSPQKMKELSQAEFYFMVGAGFNFEETWLKNFSFSDTTKKVDCSEDVKILGDNPHYWLSPKNAEIIAENIFQALVKYYPQHFDNFEKNKNQFLSALDSLDNDLNKHFENTPKKDFIVNHPAWTYFAEHYELNQISIEKEGKPAGAAELAELIEFGKKKNINTIFIEPQKNPSEAKLLADEINAEIVAIEPLPNNYLQNLKITAEKILTSLN